MKTFFITTSTLQPPCFFYGGSSEKGGNAAKNGKNYYPSGKVLRSYQAGDKAERYLTTQNERDAESGYDFRNARFSDSEIGMFRQVDPLAEKFTGWSPYNYVLNNPTTLVDPAGTNAGWYDEGENRKFDPDVHSQSDLDSRGIKGSYVGETFSGNLASNGYGIAGDANGNVSVNTTEVDILPAGQTPAIGPMPLQADNDGVGGFNSGLKQGINQNAAGLKMAEGFAIGAAMAASGGVGAGASTGIATTAAPRVFWSGEGMMNAAAQYARSTGGITLEMTAAGRVMSAVNPILPRAIANPMWRTLSASFAKGAAGEVNFFTTGAGPRAASIWMQVERPILQSNGVKIITNVVH